MAVHGHMRKRIGARVKWEFLFAGVECQMIRDCAQSHQRGFEYFRLHDPVNGGAEVGHITRRHCADGIHWRGVFHGQTIRALRSAKKTDADGCESFVLQYASAVTAARDDEPYEATARVENSPAEKAAADFAAQVLRSAEGRARPSLAKRVAKDYPATVVGAMLNQPELTYAVDPLDATAAIEAMGQYPPENHVPPDLPFEAAVL